MKSIEIEDELYAFIASQTQHIGEDASQILHRLLLGDNPIPEIKKTAPVLAHLTQVETQVDSHPVTEQISEHKNKVDAPDDSSSNVFELLENQPIDTESSRVQQWLHVLSALHQVNTDRFSKVLEITGRNRFSDNKALLLEAGSSTNPKAIPNSRYWVVTNNNTAKKLSMLTQVCELLGYSQEHTQALVAKLA